MAGGVLNHDQKEKIPCPKKLSPPKSRAENGCANFMGARDFWLYFAGNKNSMPIFSSLFWGGILSLGGEGVPILFLWARGFFRHYILDLHISKSCFFSTRCRLTALSLSRQRACYGSVLVCESTDVRFHLPIYHGPILDSPKPTPSKPPTKDRVCAKQWGLELKPPTFVA